MSETQLRQIALLQAASPRDEPSADRIERVLAMVGDAAERADLVMLPELWATGYFAFDRYATEGTSLDGDLVTSLRAIARRTGCTVFTGSFLERTTAGLHNTSALIDPHGALALVYRKYHLFGLATSRETELLVPGDELPVVDTGLGRVAAMTCYDLRFPELARSYVDRGATMLLVTAAWPAARLEHWKLLVRARAVENQWFVLACNAAGDSSGERMAGHSMVVDPKGEIVAEFGDEPESGHVDIDLTAVDETRAAFPVLADRRLRHDGARRG